ncbi:metallo-beta-lactamase superfamily protein [Hypoxylon fragiforme]|uniref:metallo-beta-lactamase superfamily protein n=1 Tax=Hypoxylon fragiforme TaxID=63214 RepID=UPI0020C5FF9A|nr:metallo-beta-lactamase superfamily protein [Hypoxylon fragiforme]KAI2603153.1 metallo-beta-lactamase superfamily protein [Hypoxylon fragiforme]
MARNPINLESVIFEDYLSAQGASLPHLNDVEQVTDRVVRIMGGNPGTMQLQGTNTYLLGTGQDRILIDTGEGKAAWSKNIIKFITENHLKIAYVLLTHWHGDHTGGIPDLIAHDPALADRIYKHMPDPGQQPIADLQDFKVQGATVRAVHTPGHAVDHMCFLLDEENALLTGDNVLGHGFSVEEDLGGYLRSLHRMRALGCAVGYPAHGAAIGNLPAKMDQYIRHKEDRERQILQVLRSLGVQKKGAKGRHSVPIDTLIELLHGDLPRSMVKAALEPFISQVLWKLAEDRKVGFELKRGRRQWFVKERMMVA